jgi:UrcA family protein
MKMLDTDGLLKPEGKRDLSNFITRVAGLAAFALIALPVTMLGTAAHAQPSVQLAGLDLTTDSGKATFAHRANLAANQACRDEKAPSILNACKAAVIAELTEKLARIDTTTRFAAAPAAHTPGSVRIADLNLASTAGKATFDDRVNSAAGEVCRHERNFSVQAACRSAVRTEATEKLALITSGVQYAAR